MYDVVIIGTGFGGISAAINLNKRGITHYIMVERRDFAGGTWCQNRYPGAAVDVQSPLYSLENEPYQWSRMFAHQSELADYTQYLLNKHGLNDKIRLNTTVVNAQWHDNAYWRLLTDNEQQIDCKVLINATGPLSTPLIPKFEGADKFEGRIFHCNDWPTDLSLEDKRVAVIGTGASAIQIIPAIVDKVKHLHLFQRTPHWILARPDFIFGKAFQYLLSKHIVYGLIKWTIYCLAELRVLALKYSPALLKLIGELPAKRHLKKQIKDKSLRKKLTPDYTIGCKRILISNTYYPVFQDNKVSLHDKQDPIVEFNKQGILSASGQINLDVIIYATGYQAQESMVSYHLVGKHGVSLATQWQSYPRAYLGTSLPYFPNFFLVTGPNTGIGHTSAIFMIESQMRYIMKCVELLQTQYQTIEPSEYAEDQYTAMVHSEMKRTVWYKGGCKSWYQNATGKVIAIFPGFSFVFRYLCKRFKINDHIIS